MTTFIVMSYIIFVNPAILAFAGVEGLQDHSGSWRRPAAAFIVYVFIRVFQGAWTTVHPLMWAAIACAINFASPIMQQEFDWI